MSGLIKQIEADIAVDRLPLARVRTPGSPPPDPRIAALETRVAELERTLAAERREADRAVAEARKSGRDDVVADDAKRTAAVEHALADVVTAWRDRLAGIDALAATLAAAALEKMFGESADLATLTARTLAHHVERLGTRTVVSVAVSPVDFPDAAALAALATEAGLASGSVGTKAELPTGACRVALRLGEVELDPATQGAVLTDALRALGEAA